MNPLTEKFFDDTTTKERDEIGYRVDAALDKLSRDINRSIEGTDLCPHAIASLLMLIARDLLNSNAGDHDFHGRDCALPDSRVREKEGAQ